MPERRQTTPAGKPLPDPRLARWAVQVRVLLQVRPRQVHAGMRLFDGMFWVDKRDYSVVKSEGVAVPQILNRKEENLFPRFTTFREKIGEHWFPVHTHSNDELAFSSGPIRQKMTIKYEEYRPFGAESTVTFSK